MSKIRWTAVALGLAFVVVFASFALAGRAGAAETVTWREGQRVLRAVLAEGELALVFRPGGAQGDEPAGWAGRAGVSGQVIESDSLAAFIRLDHPVAADEMAGLRAQAESLPGLMAVSPVYYREGAAGARMALTGRLIVSFAAGVDQGRVQEAEAALGLARLKAFPYRENTFLYQAPDVGAVIGLANRLAENGLVRYAYPEWVRPLVKRAAPNDPLFSQQWSFFNTGALGGVAGADANITPAWALGYLGRGVTVAIVDDGLYIDHPDLAPNVDPALCHDFVDEDADPSAGYHGTECGGVAAARGNNLLGLAGAAYLADLAGLRMLDLYGVDSVTAEALSHENGQIDVYSCSWGPWDSGNHTEGPGPLTLDALEASVTQGRGGLGNIYPWAGGNGNQSHDDANYDGYVNSRFTIGVAASDISGQQSYYSEPGACILVNAPSSGGVAGVVSTTPTGYTSTFGGTSAAAPLVAGVVALMLEANPQLTWRDVHQILAKTAEKNDPANPDWAVNGAGLDVSHAYGFGRVDAEAAVAAALGWTNLGPEVFTLAGESPGAPIPDAGGGQLSRSLYLRRDVNIEYVEIYFDAPDHPAWGDLTITLTSPAGTPSILGRTHASSGHYYAGWTFGTARCLEESSQGEWTLAVSDQIAGNTGALAQWSVKAFGTAAAPFYHALDYNPADWSINLSELLRAIQLYNAGGLACQPGSEDTYAPGAGAKNCTPHDSDYNPADWSIGLSELLRAIQFYNAGAYQEQAGSEDGYAPVLAAADRAGGVAAVTHARQEEGRTLVTVSFDYDEKPLALGYRARLPGAFAGFTHGPEPSAWSVRAGVLEAAWAQPPASGFSFTYAVEGAQPPGQAQALYRLGGGEETLDLAPASLPAAGKGCFIGRAWR